MSNLCAREHVPTLAAVGWQDALGRFLAVRAGTVGECTGTVRSFLVIPPARNKATLNFVNFFCLFPVEYLQISPRHGVAEAWFGVCSFVRAPSGGSSKVEAVE